MSEPLPHRPLPRQYDPNLTVLPAISAPVDQGVLLPKPPRTLWDHVLWIVALLLLAGAVLAFAFLHASPM